MTPRSSVLGTGDWGDWATFGLGLLFTALMEQDLQADVTGHIGLKGRPLLMSRGATASNLRKWATLAICKRPQDLLVLVLCNVHIEQPPP
jgi:hypothetical protein